MGAWKSQIETKARIIQSQLDAAKALSARFSNGQEQDVIAPYLAMLERLYSEELPLAKLMDDADLVARFEGPALFGNSPPVSLVTSVFVQLRGEVRNIAKSIAGLANMRGATWPKYLDPNLAGLARGSLVVGISVPSSGDLVQGGQATLEGFNEDVLATVREAVKSLPVMARLIGDENIDAAISDYFPDPAIRDAVMVSVKRLAPTGRKGYDSVTLYGSDNDGIVRPMTARSRVVLTHALSEPVRETSFGEFKGVVREIDLDARRFEIRGFSDGQGAIRCVYSAEYDAVAHTFLDAVVKVRGAYEVAPNEQPRLISAQGIEIVRPRPVQPSVLED